MAGGYRDSFEPPEQHFDYGLLAVFVSIAVIWGAFLWLMWEWMTR